MPNSLDIQTVVNGALQENCYIINKRGNRQALLVDPGAEPEKIEQAIKQASLEPVMVLATHGHFDHVGQVAHFARNYGIPFAMHGADLELLDALEDNYAFYGMGQTSRPSLDQDLAGRQKLEAAGIALTILPTPGHSPGSVCFFHEEDNALFSGDTLFKAGIGRSDFPGGSHDTLIESIRGRLFQLDDQVRVYPGHGPATTIGDEKPNLGMFGG